MALAVVVFGALLVCNAHYLFRTQLYEQGDFASNSLTVLPAKKFQAIYGNHSRWVSITPAWHSSTATPRERHCFTTG